MRTNLTKLTHTHTQLFYSETKRERERMTDERINKKIMLSNAMGTRTHIHIDVLKCASSSANQ